MRRQAAELDTLLGDVADLRDVHKARAGIAGDCLGSIQLRLAQRSGHGGPTVCLALSCTEQACCMHSKPGAESMRMLRAARKMVQRVILTLRRLGQGLADVLAPGPRVQLGAAILDAVAQRLCSAPPCVRLPDIS